MNPHCLTSFYSRRPLTTTRVGVGYFSALNASSTFSRSVLE